DERFNSRVDESVEEPEEFNDLQFQRNLTVNSGVGTPTGDGRMPRIARAAIRTVDRLRTP
ncbi:MAG: hypothetical protein HC809_07540, partial [Gammaproteobacteria bacterium]|nr:hypothetical protein [Gammaproteobacteria bacterium]